MSNKGFLLRMGNLLQEGPRTIHEANAVGSSYVEVSTSLFWHNNSFSNFRSCRIYSDACGDDDSGYLNPIARLAVWDRATDLKSESYTWPNVAVELIVLPLDCTELQHQIKRMQKRLDAPTCVSFGLPVRRDFGDCELGSDGHLRIETHAGWQSVERAFWLSDVPEFVDVLETIESVVREIGQPADIDHWTEIYDHSPDTIASHLRWEWNYRPPNEG